MAEPDCSQFDVIVVGAGLMGAATAWALSRRGRSVLVVEQYTPANTLGSSHGSARIVRRAYGDPLYTQLTGRALELWRELERQSGATILRMLGGVDFGAAGEIDRMAGYLATSHVAHEVMSVSEAEQRWPGMRFDGKVVFHPEAGTVDAAVAVETFLSEARRHGARMMEGTPVVEIRPGHERAEIELAGSRLVTAPTLVIAAGAWAAPLLTGIVELPPLAVTQQQIFHFVRLDPGAELWPSVIHADADIYHLAGGRDGGPADDRKIAEHRRGTPTTATARNGLVDPASRQRLIEYVKRWLPGLEPTPRREATCLYTTTPNEDFILDRVGTLVVCSPCSGHGAKFAPLIGELTADLATTPGKSQIPRRFQLGSHLS